MAGIQIDDLKAISSAFGDVVSDPQQWPDVLHRFSQAVGATGTALLPYSLGPEHMQVSQGIKDAVAGYVKEGWHEEGRDPRRRAVVKHLRGEAAADDDVITPDEMRRSPFYNALPRFGLRWWAGVGFWGGPDLWCLAVQRSEREGQFTPKEKEILNRLSARLSEISALSHTIGRSAALQFTDALNALDQPAVSLDHSGRAIHINAAAEALFDNSFRVVRKAFYVRDPQSMRDLERLIGRVRWAPEGVAMRADPVIVRRADASPVVVRALPVDGSARTPFGGARAILLLKEIKQPGHPELRLVQMAFGLTPAEARLAACLANGTNLEDASVALGIAKETARSHLKAIFFKTDTHHQSELVALLSTLPRIPVRRSST
jgi:DNA-binding CsgD family transcriptional regulator